jgi:hypothetical protein
LKKILFSIIIFLVITGGLCADEFTSTEHAQEIIENAVTLFVNQQFEDAVTLLKPYTVMNSIVLDNLALTAKQQWPSIVNNYGRIVDIEFIRTETVGNSLVKIIYLAKLEQYALCFETILYQASNGWVVVNFSFNDQIEDLFLKKGCLSISFGQPFSFQFCFQHSGV